MQVAGPYDLLGAVRRALPKTLPVLGGESVAMEWYLGDELPVTPPNAKGEPRPNPHGVFRILAPIVMRNAVSADANAPYRLQPTPQSDPLVYSTGTLSYLVTEQDIESVQTVTGTLGGTPGHVFVANTDYTFTVDSIVWTGTGALPDNGTTFTVAYRHRMYYPRRVMDERVTVRAIVKAQAYTSPSRQYPMSTFAAVLGNALTMKLRAMSANRLVAPATVDVPYTETATMGRVLAGGPLPLDPSGSLASWFVDFTLAVSGIWEDDPVQSILDMPFEIEFEQ